MTQAIVTYLNAVIDTVGRVDERYCIAELRSDGTATVPYAYVGNGKVKPISIDGGSLSYWRISGAVPPMEQIASQYGKPRLSATYPLRLVIIARRADSTVDDGFMPTRLAEDIANALTGSHPDLKLLLKANTVSVSAGYDVNITSVWADEFKGTGVNDPNYTRTIMALSVSVTVVGDRACWENECDYDPDILHLFDFCQAGTVARLTDSQVTCLQDALCEACEDATVTVNTAPFGTATSGGALNVPVVNGGANPVGSKQGSDWVIGNNATFINGTQVTDQEAEVDANIFVTLDGVQDGTWNAMTQTWEVTGGASASISVAVSDTTPNFGQTITITATPTGLTPTSYLFFAYQNSTITFIAEQAGSAVNWLNTLAGAFDIYALATDGTIKAYGTQSLTGTSTLVLDQIAVMPNWAIGLRRLTINYTGVAALVMRSSDSLIMPIGYIGENLDTAELISHVGVGNGFSAQIFDQIASNNPQQTTAVAIPSVVVAGTVQTINGKPTVIFDGATDEMVLTNDVTFVHGFVVAAKASNTNVVQYVLGGTGQGLSFGGSAAPTILIATGGGVLTSAIDNTTPHQVSFKTGVAGSGVLRVDGVVQATGTTSATMTINRVGVRPDALLLKHVGRFSEAFTYAAALTNAQQLTIEANQKAYYGTP